MKDILLARNRPVLERLASGRSLLAFDYDGVLAPVVRDPHGAPMRPSTRRLLVRLARAWPCAVISGRAWDRTRRLTEDVVPIVVGNHGFELGHPRTVPREVLERVRGWRAALGRELDGVPGVYFEEKRSTLAVHYGLERRWRSIEAAVHREAARLEGARLVHGKKVLNVIPEDFPNKGDAVRALLRKLRLTSALYAGDDVTDEDAFRVGPPEVIGVRVGAGRSRAPFRLSAQDRIDELLEVLVRLRSGRAIPAAAERGRSGAERGRGGAERERPGARREAGGPWGGAEDGPRRVAVGWGMAAPKPGQSGDLFSQVRPRPLGVGELTRLLRAQVEPRFRDLWVAGEVASFRRQASGHLYFSLKDDEASISAVVWASQARRIRFSVSDGLEVVVRGFVEIYPPHGKYQLVVQELEPRGAGAQALQLQQLKERLQQDGLLDPARKRPLPFLPRRVGVATSPTGAALRDFLRVLHARHPGMPVLVAPCRVQGEGAPATVASALRALCRAGCDVLVVTRGGGSQDDLAAFNDERLARAIAACPVPVVSAVGHEVDVTVADLVADVRAATPTHAAQLVVPVKEELQERLAALRARLTRSMLEGVSARRRELRALRAELSDPAHLLSQQRHRLDDLAHRAEGAVRARARAERVRLEPARARLASAEPRARLRKLVRRAEDAARRLGRWQAVTFPRERLRLERLQARLEPANVARMLERGFALVLDGSRLVTQSGSVEPGDALRVALRKGWLDVRVESRDSGIAPLPAAGPKPR